MINKKTEKLYYRITVKDHLDKSWTEWFESLNICHKNDGATTLTGPVADQCTLHSILHKIRDMNLFLISIEQIDEQSPEDKEYSSVSNKKTKFHKNSANEAAGGESKLHGKPKNQKNHLLLEEK